MQQFEVAKNADILILLKCRRLTQVWSKNIPGLLALGIRREICRNRRRYRVLNYRTRCGGSIPPWDELTLTGDWNGLRSSLYRQGITIEPVHKSDVVANTAGGLKRGASWLGHTDFKIKFDLATLWGWNATTIYLHYHSDLGGKPNTHRVGSFMGVDNIEAVSNTGQFYHAWLQKSFFNDSLSILAGIYPVDSEFYVTDTSALFIHPSFGMAAEAGQTADNGHAQHPPPIFNTASVGVRVKYTSPSRTMYLMGAVNDAVPGDPNNPHGTQIKLGNGEGTLSMLELGYTPLEAGHTFETVQPAEAAILEPEIKAHEKYEGFNKTALGFWHYSARYNDLSETDAAGNPLRRHRQGAYFLAERSLYAEKEDPNQGLAGFVRFGMASKGVHQSDWSGSFGLRYHGLIPGRDDDIAGIAMTTSHASKKYRRVNAAERSETAIEASYRAQLRPWIACQPMIQRIFNPNMNSMLNDAWFLGLRTEIIF